MMKNEITYLLSSFKNNPQRLFQGYCFDKADFIFGQEGADKYYEETGNELSFCEDGCYVLARKTKEGYLIGADCSGYKKILYFQDGNTGTWAVSNSLNILIEHLVENSIKVTPNIPLLMMMSQGPSVAQQPITFNTIANEIKILPINTSLLIGKNTLEINKVDKIETQNTNYHDMLLSFVNIWLSRFSTLLSCKAIHIQQGLTGGVDSRALFSLSNYAYHNEETEISADYRLVSSLTRGDDTDMKIAQMITNHYGHELNDKRPTSYNPETLTNEEKYLGWKNICIGLYHPIYFPTAEIDFRKITIGGHGGENHRIFYAKNSKIKIYNDFIKNLCYKIKDSNLKIDLAIDLYETLTQMQEADICGDEIDPLILHYRHFRSRFHSGLFPQYRVSFTPLSSRYLNSIATKENANKMQGSQILYDLINITDDLLGFPFDKSNKAPKDSNLDQLTTISPNLNIQSGTVYTGVKVCKEDKYLGSKKPLFKYLKEDFDKACSTEIVKKVWSRDVISEASKTLDEAIRNKRFNHATEGIPISAIIATGLFS